MEIVTGKINSLRGYSPHAINSRKTACPKGHPLTGTNLVKYELGRGRRVCKRCQYTKTARTQF